MGGGLASLGAASFKEEQGVWVGLDLLGSGWVTGLSILFGTCVKIFQTLSLTFSLQSSFKLSSCCLHVLIRMSEREQKHTFKEM